MDRIKEIAHRANLATKGPWEVGGPHPQVSVIVCVDPGSTHIDCPEPPTYEPVALLGENTNPQVRYDAEFIAHAREDIPFLLERIAELMMLLLRYGGHLGGCADPYSNGQLACDCGWQKILKKDKRIAELEAEIAAFKAKIRDGVPVDAPFLTMLGFHRDDACAARWHDAASKEITELKAELSTIRSTRMNCVRDGKCQHCGAEAPYCYHPTVEEYSQAMRSIAELESESRCPVCLGKKEVNGVFCGECYGKGYASVAYEHVRGINKRLSERIAELEAALREIAEHPHCRINGCETDNANFLHGYTHGNLYAAEIARKALDSGTQKD